MSDVIIPISLPVKTVFLSSNAPGPAGPAGPAAVADVAFSFQGTILANEELAGYVLAHGVTLDQATSRAKCMVAPTANTTLTLKKNGVSMGTVFFATGVTTGVVTLSSTALVAGDIISAVGPSVADLSLATVMITLAGQDT